MREQIKKKTTQNIKKNIQSIAIWQFLLLLKYIVLGISTAQTIKIPDSSTTSETKAMEEEQKTNKNGLKILKL